MAAGLHYLHLAGVTFTGGLGSYAGFSIGCDHAFWFGGSHSPETDKFDTGTVLGATCFSLTVTCGFLAGRHFHQTKNAEAAIKRVVQYWVLAYPIGFLEQAVLNRKKDMVKF